MSPRIVIFTAIVLIFLSYEVIVSQDNFNKRLIERQNYLSQLEAGKIRTTEEYLFNNIKWGSSVDAVRSVYADTPLFESEKELNYAYDIGNIRAILVFEFYYNNLINIKLVVRASDNYNIADSEYKKVYSKIVDHVRKKVKRHENYADTLRLRDMQRYPLGNPENIESILHVWNFRSTIIKAEYDVAPGIPIMVTYSKKPR